MDLATLRAWWFDRQGLPFQLKGTSASEVLTRTGWARSVGGSNPYLSLFSRAGISRQDAESATENLDIHELPSARGCTYMVPRQDFQLGLRLAQGDGENSDVKVAKKFLGVTESELSCLEEAVLGVLGSVPKDPAEIRSEIGDKVRNLGPEGKKRGQTTTLPLALGRLQERGLVRRKSTTGRLDNQHYGYVKWFDLPQTALPYPEALAELAQKYFDWVGIASLANFQWFAGVSAKSANAAIMGLGLVPLEPRNESLGGDWMATPEGRESLYSFKRPSEPSISLVTSLDGLFLHRRDIKNLVEEADLGRKMQGDRALYELGKVMDLSHNAIVDRGQIVGLWEFDPENGQIAYHSFDQPSERLRNAVRVTEDFIRTQLGDCRSFSLDSSASRRPKIEFLSKMTP
jgi:Winged helix DNA-binding domain